MAGAEVGQILDFVRSLEASGGGDDPEPVELALKVALGMAWRADAQGNRRSAMSCQGSPGHVRSGDAVRNSTQQAELPRVVSTIFAGNEPASAKFFEQIATAGGGEYSVNQGQIIESVLLSIIPEKGAQLVESLGRSTATASRPGREDG